MNNYNFQQRNREMIDHLRQKDFSEAGQDAERYNEWHRKWRNDVIRLFLFVVFLIGLLVIGIFLYASALGVIGK